jgi:hypothetical protein
MRDLSLALVAAVAAMAGIGPASAGDYPFTGYYTIAGNAAAADPLDVRRCAVTFFVQNADGAYTAYHVDHDLFRRTGEVSYLIFQRGTCSYDGAHRRETCANSFDTAPGEQGRVFYDVIETMGPDYIRTTMFDTLADAEAYGATGDKGPGFGDAYYRCRFDEARLVPALSMRASLLGTSARDQLTWPGDDFLAGAGVAAIARAMGLVP